MTVASLSNRQAKNKMYRIEHFIFCLSVFYIYLFEKNTKDRSARSASRTCPAGHKNTKFDILRQVRTSMIQRIESALLSKRWATYISIKMFNRASKSSCEKGVKLPYLPQPFFCKNWSHLMQSYGFAFSPYVV